MKPLILTAVAAALICGGRLVAAGAAPLSLGGDTVAAPDLQQLEPLVGQRSGGHPGRRGPPQEAIEACQGLKAGSSCAFSTRSGDSIQGTCRQPPRGDTVVCVPEGGPPRR